MLSICIPSVPSRLYQKKKDQFTYINNLTNATHPPHRLKLTRMRTTYLTALSLTICAVLTIAAPPSAGLEARSSCVEDGQCSLGGPSDRGQSCSDLNCCSGQKAGAGNGVGAPQPICPVKCDLGCFISLIACGLELLLRRKHGLVEIGEHRTRSPTLRADSFWVVEQESDTSERAEAFLSFSRMLKGESCVPYEVTNHSIQNSAVTIGRPGPYPFASITRVGFALVSMYCFEFTGLCVPHTTTSIKVSSSNETPVSAVDFSPSPKSVHAALEAGVAFASS